MATLSPPPLLATPSTHVAHARVRTFSFAASSCFLAKSSSSDSLAGRFFGTFLRGQSDPSSRAHPRQRWEGMNGQRRHVKVVREH